MDLNERVRRFLRNWAFRMEEGTAVLEEDPYKDDRFRIVDPTEYGRGLENGKYLGRVAISTVLGARQLGFLDSNLLVVDDWRMRYANLSELLRHIEFSDGIAKALIHKEDQ